MQPSQETSANPLIVERREDLPPWADFDVLAKFFHETMVPWNDSLEDVEAALNYTFSDADGKGGYLALVEHDGALQGALAMLETGMGGYVPGHILLFVSVDPSARGQGVGERLIRAALDHAPGDVKLHVEYENPAKRLYERLGFVSKYAEMRYSKS
jgi:ribosomal-protein-alanine N-acetyltransferase